MLFLSVRGFSDYAGPNSHSRLVRTLVVNPPACHPLQAHLVLESHLPFRLILYWTRLSVDSVSRLGRESVGLDCFADSCRQPSKLAGWFWGCLDRSYRE